MPSSTTELIKSKLDIVDFLRGYLTLTPAGKNFKAVCPFHREKTPSFMVSPERQSWHCFGCSLGGDIFGFVMRYENVEFGEALRMLAEKAGVELRRENPAEYKFSGLLYDLNDAAKNYFRKALAVAPVAKKYLADRGLAQETADTFELGWAPNEPEALSMHLLNAGAAPQDIIQAGLSMKTERGLMLDRFRGRIMFPIHNHLGKVVGFTGRILPQLEKEIAARMAAVAGAAAQPIAKYVNSPETPIFQKSKLLYGFWKSKDAIRETKSAFLVEGQMDFLMSWQSGVRNVIASSGTALTADHLRAVHRFADELVLCFDNDVAGSDAAERAIDLGEANDFAVKVAVIDPASGFKDAADAAKADPENVRRAFTNAIPAPEFYFKKYLPAAVAGPADAKANASARDAATRELATRDGLRKLRVVLVKLKSIASPVERGYWLKELSKRTGIAERTLEEESTKAPQTGIPARAEKEEEIAKRSVTRAELITEELFSAAFAKNNFALLDDCAQFFTPRQKEIARILKSGKHKSEDPTLDEVIGLVMLRASGDFPGETVDALKAELAKEYYKERRKVLAQAIKNAEARGNETELKAALEEIAKLPVVTVAEN
ncbi:MAG TPA: DNA primase [Candidatus Paceibacterota bacterium]|jgi:DNA primase|nr:DNA primase [Candidatus Paceibacterota bacterium]